MPRGHRKWRCAHGTTIPCNALVRRRLLFPASSSAQFAAAGNLDCNGLSQIQKPLKTLNVCADPRGLDEGYSRFYDNGKYIGHDEPSMGFYSHAPNSGNNMQWQITLPVERPYPGATQTLRELRGILAQPGTLRSGFVSARSVHPG